MKRSSISNQAVSRLARCLCLLCGLLSFSAALASPGSTGIVHTDDGDLLGITMGDMHAFLGIPYAAPPVGDLRWRAPLPPKPWHGVLYATQFAPHCPQNASPFGLPSDTEDCLYLNVYTPQPNPGWDAGRGGERWFGRARPVMVWIHGGAFVYGESDGYDPAALVGEGVIVVTLNYRLGALGFLAHPALANGDSGKGPVILNYGLRDQLAALHWVQRNIWAFGGDPGNVTLFGESAGGLSTFAHVESPLAAGLLSKAIVESGAYSLALPTLAQAEAAGTAYASAIGCTNQTAECLRSAPLSTILANEPTNYVPSVDGVVLPTSLAMALSSGTFNRVPILQGTNHDEWRLFTALYFDLVGSPLTAATYTGVTQATYGTALGSAILAAYPATGYPSADLAYSAQGTDSIFACPGQIAIGDMAQYVPVFAYEFNDPNAPEDFLPPVSFPYASAHASELQYLFTLNGTLYPPTLNASQQALSKTMVDYWTRFAKDSNPNQRGTPYWPQYSTTTDAYQMLTPGSVMPEYGFTAEHQCTFWAPILQGEGI